MYKLGSQDDPEPCRLRNMGGSECGTCPCEGPTDCPDPLLFTPIGMALSMAIDQMQVKYDRENDD